MVRPNSIAWNGKEEKAAPASAVRRDIFVADQWKEIQAPLGAAYIAPDGAGHIFGWLAATNISLLKELHRACPSIPNSDLASQN
jgi:hypothetical protein